MQTWHRFNFYNFINTIQYETVLPLEAVGTWWETESSIKLSRASSSVRWLNGECTNVSRTISVPVISRRGRFRHTKETCLPLLAVGSWLPILLTVLLTFNLRNDHYNWLQFLIPWSLKLVKVKFFEDSNKVFVIKASWDILAVHCQNYKHTNTPFGYNEKFC
jgi:hypothetical protein